MESVKWVLLNTHFWCCYVDILICSLITPYFFFPTISGFPVGLFRVLGIPTSAQVFMGLVSCMFMGISLVALFENRSSCITSNRFRIEKRKTRVFYYSFNCLVVIVYLIPPFCRIPEQESAKLALLQVIPCPTEEFFYTEVFVWATDSFWINYLWISTGSMCLSLFIQILFFFICCLYYLYISSASMVSTKTRKYQRSFFISTLAQTMVPFFLLALPITGAISCIYFDYYNQAFNNLFVLVVSIHGFASTFIIIFAHHPYRRFAIKVITFDRSEEKHVSTGFSHVTREIRAGMRRPSNRVLPNIL